MNILKTMFMVMVVFDVVYFFLYFGHDLCSTIYTKITKKKKPDTLNFEIDVEDEEFSLAPPLCVDSIRLVYGSRCKDLVTDRILPLSKEISEQLNEEDKTFVILLLSSCFRYLNLHAPKHEQNFSMVMEMLNAAQAIFDPEARDPLDMLMEDSLSDRFNMPAYYLDYQKYRFACKNKAHILTVCKVLILAVLKKLYGEYYCPNDELYVHDSAEAKLRAAKIEAIDLDFEYGEDADAEMEDV
ncbi:MAG: hypothetical protein IJN67_01680 [Oscillospiraceae bacterium]|nr:hypothetical protein [Oscillospiraceae bacterium]